MSVFIHNNIDYSSLSGSFSLVKDANNVNTWF